MRINLSGLGEIVRKTKSDDFYQCPFCDDDKGHLGVSRNKGIFHCFKCNASGRIRDLKPSLNEFTERVKERLEPRETIVTTPTELELPESFRYITCDRSNRAFRYLIDRRIDEEEIERYDIGQCISGFFAHRIIIPIYEKEKLTYFVGRTYMNAVPRYMNSPTPKKGIIFKTFETRVSEAIIVEGIYDALRIGKWFPTIALLGKIADKEQLIKIEALATRTKVMLDNDAHREGFNLYNQLNNFMHTKVIFINQKDPGELTKEEVYAYLQ